MLVWWHIVHKAWITPQGRTGLLPGNRTGTTLKILCYDGQGYWLCTKRLSQGRFTWWPQRQDASYHLCARELLVLLWNGHPHQAGMAEDWRKLA